MVRYFAINTFGGVCLGVVIYTDNADKYKVGTFIETTGLIYPPTGEGITYIVHGWKPDDPDWWAAQVPYRLVVVCKKCNPNGESILLDFNDKSKGWNTEVGAMLKWADRDRVRQMLKGAPIPLMLAWLKENNRNIELWRRLSRVAYTLPDEYAEATIAYGMKGRRGRPKYPHKKKASKGAVHGFRESDLYIEQILQNSTECANEMRDVAKDKLPKSLKKTKQDDTRWF